MSRHEWWAVQLRDHSKMYCTDAIEACFAYIAELEAEPTVDQWLDSMEIEPMLTIAEMEEIMNEVDPMVALVEWFNTHAKPPQIIDVETGERT